MVQLDGQKRAGPIACTHLDHDGFEHYPRITRALGGVQLLILDDWGLEPLDHHHQPVARRGLARRDRRSDLCRRHPRPPRPQRPPPQPVRRQPAEDKIEASRERLTEPELRCHELPASKAPRAGREADPHRAALGQHGVSAIAQRVTSSADSCRRCEAWKAEPWRRRIGRCRVLVAGWRNPLGQFHSASPRLG